MNVKNEIDKITLWMQKYADKTNCKGVVLGLSGGKDSTVVAMLAKKVFGDNVVCVMMPNGAISKDEFDSSDFKDSIDIAKKLGVRYTIVSIQGAFDDIIDNINTGISGGYFADNDPQHEYLTVSDKAKTNIAPRLRMTTLYAIAQSLGYRVIGTGNASEAYVGWCTKYGDCGYDFNPIAHLTKSDVVKLGKELAKEFNLDEKFIDKAPSDGLTGKTDEDNFGFTYDELDEFIKHGKYSNVGKAKTFLHMNRISEHKRRMPYTLNDDIEKI